MESSLTSVWKHDVLKELQDTSIYILHNLNGEEHICVYTYTHEQLNRNVKQKSDKSLYDQVIAGSEGN